MMRLWMARTLTAFLCVMMASAAASADVWPELACVKDNGDGTYTAHFQVWNTEGEPVVIPIGPDNRFSPGPDDRGQTTIFQSMGRITPLAAVITWDGTPLTWHVNGHTATARASSNDCDCVGLIHIEPAEVTARVGEDVTLVATVWDGAGELMEGIEVTFYDFQGSVNDVFGRSDTDANGQAFFTYTSQVEGEDIIDAKVRNVGCVRDDLLTYCESHVHWIPCIEEVITLDPNGSSGTVGDEHCVTATLETVDGDPIEGRELTFETTDGSANTASGTATTDENGQATFCYIGENEGEDWIAVWAVNCDGDMIDATVDQTWVCPELTLTLAPETSSGPIGTEHTVTATLLEDGVPVEGVTVDFQTLGGSANDASGSSVTDANGEATFSYIGFNLGTDSILATVEDSCTHETVKSNHVMREWECPPEEIVLAPATSSGEIGETHTVVATLTRTDSGAPLVGVTVNFATVSGSANTASGSDVTDANGQASFSYVGENPGTDTIEASFTGCTGGTVKSNNVIREWNCPFESLTLAPQISSGPIGTEHTIVATLLDVDSNPIAGRLVNFMTLGGSANSAMGSDTTDASGQATFSYIAENLGTDFLMATVADCAGASVESNVVEREWECPPEGITLEPQTSEGPIGTEHTVTATVTRTDTGDPLEGRTVEFMTLPGSANDASGNATTDANGVATFSYTGENTGLDMIQASFSDCSMTVVQSNVVERVWTCPIENVTLAPESSEGPVDTEHTVTATVTDEDGQPVQGRDVMFETLAGSANDAMGTSKTDANGQASFTYTGENEGLDTIRATISDCLGDQVVSNVVERDWTCPAEMMTISADPPMPTVGMEVKVVAIVTTASGEPVEGRDVTFEFLPGSVSTGGGTFPTNANGKAKFIYTQGDVGEDFILATAEDCSGNLLEQEIEVLWAECFLWVGKKKDDTPLSPPDQDIQLVKKIKLNLAVLEDDIPTIRIPNRPSLLGRHVYAQVYLSNPTIFPEDPIQTSNGIDITLGVDQLPVPYGPEFGIDLWSNVPALLGQDWTVQFDVRNL